MHGRTVQAALNNHYSVIVQQISVDLWRVSLNGPAGFRDRHLESSDEASAKQEAYSVASQHLFTKGICDPIGPFAALRWREY